MRKSILKIKSSYHNLQGLTVKQLECTLTCGHKYLTTTHKALYEKVECPRCQLVETDESASFAFGA